MADIATAQRSLRRMYGLPEPDEIRLLAYAGLEDEEEEEEDAESVFEEREKMTPSPLYPDVAGTSLDMEEEFYPDLKAPVYVDNEDSPPYPGEFPDETKRASCCPRCGETDRRATIPARGEDGAAPEQTQQQFL